MAVSQQTQLQDLDQYKFGFHDPEKYHFKSRRGLDEQIVRDISEMKNEPVVGERHTLEGDNIATRVLHTRRSARLDTSELRTAPGSIAARLREMGFRCTVAVPIIVDARVWGMAAVGSLQPEPLPPDTEARMSDFADLVATAVANAATRAETVSATP